MFVSVMGEYRQREEPLTTVTNTFMSQYTIPIDTNQLPKLPSRDDVETWWMTNDDSGVLDSDKYYNIFVPTFIPIC